MHKKLELPKISNREAAELAQACRLAYGDNVDDFMDRVFGALRERRQRRDESGQMWFPE